MGKSRLGGDEQGLGLYEMIVCSDEEYKQVISLIDQNRYKEARAILGIKESGEEQPQTANGKCIFS